MCSTLLQFATTGLIPIKATSLMKTIGEINKSLVNPQLPISPAERQTLYHSLYTYIHTIGISSPYNMALPYKLFYSIGSNDTKAIQEYADLFLTTYSKEFFEYYLYTYVVLFVFVRSCYHRAYSCTDEYVPNKKEIAECVMGLLDANECFNDELLGELIEVHTSTFFNL